MIEHVGRRGVVRRCRPAAEDVLQHDDPGEPDGTEAGEPGAQIGPGRRRQLGGWSAVVDGGARSGSWWLLSVERVSSDWNVLSTPWNSCQVCGDAAMRRTRHRACGSARRQLTREEILGAARAAVRRAGLRRHERARHRRGRRRVGADRLRQRRFEAGAGRAASTTSIDAEAGIYEFIASVRRGGTGSLSVVGVPARRAAPSSSTGGDVFHVVLAPRPSSRDRRVPARRPACHVEQVGASTCDDSGIWPGLSAPRRAVRASTDGLLTECSALRTRATARPRAHGQEARAAGPPAAVPSAYMLGALGVHARCPRRDSNARTRLRRPMLYPLSYEGGLGSMPPTARSCGSGSRGRESLSPRRCRAG